MPTLIVFPDLLKAHVSGYTRKDGAFVQEHDDKRKAAAPKPTKFGAPYPATEKQINHGKYTKNYNNVDDDFGATDWANQASENADKYGHDYAAGALRHAGRLLHDKAHKAEKRGMMFAAKSSHEAGNKLLERAAKHDAKHAASKGGGASGKPTTPDAVKQHAVAAGAKHGSSVSVFSDPKNAHSFAAKAVGSKGGSFVMSHPDHGHHVVVGGADAMRMEKNGYRHVKPSA